MHPEYHAIIEAPERHVDRDYRPSRATSIRSCTCRCISRSPSSSRSISRRGIVAQFERLRAARGDAHAALHDVVECLGEVVWQAQRTGTGPDAALYLDCLARR